ncbi:hypothetical protein Hanom_Chr13g01195811 [Helianthus anomalus]
MILLTFLINLTSEQQHLKLLHTCLIHDWYVTGGKLSGRHGGDLGVFQAAFNDQTTTKNISVELQNRDGDGN